MKSDNISFIDVSYDELNSMPLKALEAKIIENMKLYHAKISSMSIEQVTKMREDVKETRKQKFRFSQETANISKDRIQIALTHLAKLFRKLDDQIKDQRNA
ncbi:MAG: hypothetical protein K5793_02665 [Nitrosarchaeum sp.]|nr:hypothetical protein [Nitrosarchaeum sp.]MCV0400200.1 hypothetical protein [Nitrosarchaeum sp.]